MHFVYRKQTVQICNIKASSSLHKKLPCDYVENLCDYLWKPSYSEQRLLGYDVVCFGKEILSYTA
jgi:hypothetical protein